MFFFLVRYFSTKNKTRENNNINQVAVEEIFGTKNAIKFTKQRVDTEIIEYTETCFMDMKEIQSNKRV
jgi:hypothetical protein